jgi:predicted HTH transcriptional regulator
MTRLVIFISSVQKELAEERGALKEYIEGDALLSRFFEVILFETFPAADRRADHVYLDQVDRCDLFVGLFGNEYGYEDAAGVSPTEREFDRATQQGKTRLIYVKGADDKVRHPKMAALIRKAGDQLIRRRFGAKAELVAAVYSSLVQVLEDRELIRTGPFDATFCKNATLADLDEERISRFVGLARRARGFPLPEDSNPVDILTHLNLLDKGRPSHAAVLLFAKHPQRFLISSELKCAHFHGTAVEKPIPSYQVYKGDVFELVDQALDFVMSKIDRWIGTRAESAQAPSVYEIPREVIGEAIVNAVAHRDYTSSGSVQVMLFSDRLEVWNPGAMPPALTLEKLRHPHASFPGNPLLAEPLYLTKYIERMGTGTGDMIRRCREAGLPEPEFRLDGGCFVLTIRRKTGQVTTQVTGQVGEQDKMLDQSVLAEVAAALNMPATQVTMQVAQALSAAAMGPQSRDKMQTAAGLANREHFRKAYLDPLVTAGWLSRTIPDKPTSRLQKYRLTEKGRAWLSKVRPRVRRSPEGEDV